MPREIKFRAKSDIGGWWIYSNGYYYDRFNYWFTIPDKSNEAIAWANHHIIDPKTLGEYINLKDKDNKEIFEGDRVSYAGLNGTVIYDENTCSFKVKSDGRQRVQYQPLHKTCQAQITVIGNIYES